MMRSGGLSQGVPPTLLWAIDADGHDGFSRVLHWGAVFVRLEGAEWRRPEHDLIDART